MESTGKSGNELHVIEESGKLLAVDEAPALSPSSDAVEETATAVLADDEWEYYIPDPPDGGWGWVVMVASFFNNFIVDGISYGFGVYLKEYLDFFSSTRGETSLANALLCGVYLLVGPLVGAMVNRFGMRRIGIIGSLVAAAAFVISTFSPSILVFQATYGFFGGLGFGMLYLPSVVGVGFYFEKKRALATGVAVCGTGVGTFCIALLMKELLKYLDWKGAHFVFASIVLQGCIFCALIRPLEVKRRRLQKTHADVRLMVSDEVIKSSETIKSDRSQRESSNPRSRSMSTSSYYVGRSGSISPIPNSSVVQWLHASAFIDTSGHRDPASIAQDLTRPLYKKDIFFSHSVLDIRRRESTPSVAPAVSLEPEQMEMNELQRPFHCFRKLPKQMADILQEMLDVRLLQNKAMLLLCAANITGMAGFYLPLVYSTDRAYQLGVSHENAALLISIIGILNTIGRVLAGAITHIPRLSPILVNSVCTLTAGVFVLLTPFCTTYPAMVVTAAGYGLLGSAFIALSSVIVCDLIGLEKLTNGFGLICLVRGMTAIAAPPFAGWLYDVTQNYDATFYMGGFCIISSGVLHALLMLPGLKSAEKE